MYTFSPGYGHKKDYDEINLNFFRKYWNRYKIILKDLLAFKTVFLKNENKFLQFICLKSIKRLKTLKCMHVYLIFA